MTYKNMHRALHRILGHYALTAPKEDIYEEAKSVAIAVQALKVVETLTMLVEQTKIESVSVKQIKQVLDEYMGGDEK